MRKKILFIDRDGTLIQEPPITFQVDDLSQLSFLPGAIRNLYKICTEMDYIPVMVTNQDGLGTDKYPQANFDAVQNKMLEILGNEGIHFYAIHIDRSFPEEKLPTRKPGTAMLMPYMNGDYDLANSFVIGDRNTDVQLAQNLGCKAIFLKNYEAPAQSNALAAETNSWDEVYQYLRGQYRTAAIKRNTTETQIDISLQLDGSGRYAIDTGIDFFNHMLEQLARHSGIDLSVTAKGDLHIDEHHTIEDVAIALGSAFSEALGKKAGINRYGFCLPMDDCLAQVAIDFGGRPWLVWEADFTREKIGDMPTEMFYHFFKSFSDGARCNLNIKAEGSNEHHKAEAIFKALAKSIKMAIKKETTEMSIPSTKGIL